MCSQSSIYDTGEEIFLRPLANSLILSFVCVIIIDEQGSSTSRYSSSLSACEARNRFGKTVKQDIDEGFDTCCNEAFSCNGTSYQAELPEECTPKEKKNKPWGN